MKKIDLGMGGEMCGASVVAKSSGPPEKYYPSFNYSGSVPLDIPEEGEMTITYKKTSSSDRTKSDGSKEYSCQIDVREIVGIEPETADDTSSQMATNPHKEAYAALHALAASLDGKKKSY